MSSKKVAGRAHSKKRKAAPCTRGSPVDQLDASDPGATTQRNFRYQHAYGVILVVQALRGELPYVAIWCEQHEDLLCERSDGRFDGWQIKTSTPEHGPWQLLDDEMVRAIGHFCEHVARFGDSIADLFFASNTKVDHVTPTSTDDARRGRCPDLFLEHVRSCVTDADIQSPFKSTFDRLVALLGVDACELFTVLKRVRTAIGPSRHDFDAVIAHEHLGALPQCRGLTAARLSEIKDELIRRVSEACSLKVTDGARHVRPSDSNDGKSPTLMAKRIPIESVLDGLLADSPYAAVGAAVMPLKLGPTRSIAAGTVLRTKARRGKVDEDYAQFLQDIARATEYHLMKQAARRPEAYADMEAALVSAVVFEYQQAYLRVKQHGEPFGEALVLELQERCRRLSDHYPDRVWRQSDESLMGIVGLLADDCKVWFSRRFPISTDGEDLELAS